MALHGGMRTVLLMALAVLISGQSRGPDEETFSVAVIVNAKNPTTDLSWNKLKSYLKLNRKFWEGNRKPSRLYLRDGASPEMQILLEKVYRKSFGHLRQDFERRLNRGDISYRPKPVPRDKDALGFVKQDVGAFTVVDARLVKGKKLEDIRVLTIDKKKPGEKGYPLASKKRSTVDS